MNKFEIDARGPNGNIFAILAEACRLLRQLGEDPAPLCEKVTSSSSYGEALDAIRAYFPVRLE